jgi:hypothetical protein
LFAFLLVEISFVRLTNEVLLSSLRVATVFRFGGNGI